MPEYKRPGFLTTNVLNKVMILATKVGLSPSGAYTLAVAGRTSGNVRTMPVNPLTFEGKRYLVAPRGDTHWVRNLRAAGTAELRLGRKKESIHVAEVVDGEKAPILKAYLDRWGSVTATHFGVPKTYTAADIERIVPRSPVFVIQ